MGEAGLQPAVGGHDFTWGRGPQALGEAAPMALGGVGLWLRVKSHRWRGGVVPGWARPGRGIEAGFQPAVGRHDFTWGRGPQALGEAAPMALGPLACGSG